MIKKINSIIILSSISMSTLAANDAPLNEYNQEIDRYYKGLKNNSIVLNRLADKELSGATITQKDYKKVFFLNCSSLGYMNKITTINKKTKYKDLEKAQRLQKLIIKTKEVMDVTEKDCERSGIYVPLA